MNTDDLIQCNDEAWSRLHKRVHDTDGLIVDLGCLGWNWPVPFIGKRPVLGVDPFEKNEPAGCDLVSGLIGPFNGTVKIADEGYPSSPLHGRGEPKLMYRWRDLVDEGRKVAALKINIEGTEWPLLCSWPDEYFENIDQIAVSFHNYKWAGYKRITSGIIDRLRQWYECIPIFEQYCWWLCVKIR